MEWERKEQASPLPKWRWRPGEFHKHQHLTLGSYGVSLDLSFPHLPSADDNSHPTDCSEGEVTSCQTVPDAEPGSGRRSVSRACHCPGAGCPALLPFQLQRASRGAIGAAAHWLPSSGSGHMGEGWRKIQCV